MEGSVPAGAVRAQGPVKSHAGGVATAYPRGASLWGHALA